MARSEGRPAQGSSTGCSRGSGYRLTLGLVAPMMRPVLSAGTALTLTTLTPRFIHQGRRSRWETHATAEKPITDSVSDRRPPTPLVRRHGPLEAQLRHVQPGDERVDEAHRVVRRHIFIQRLRKQDLLLPVH